MRTLHHVVITPDRVVVDEEQIVVDRLAALDREREQSMADIADVINRDVKTAGRVKIGDLIVEKLLTTSGSDTWAHDWLMACQDHLAGGGLVPSEYWETMTVNELAEDGKSVLNSWLLDEVWPKKIDGIEFDRTASENSIEHIEFSVGTCDKI